MKYQSQRVAYYFFAVAMLLLCLQIVYGFIMAFAHMGYDGLHDYIPFNTARASHNNLLVVWLLCGFMGAAYFIIPDETGRELFSPTLALIQLAGLFFGLFSAALLYLPGMIDTTNQTMDAYWRWWVVHLWVEGVWELILGGLLSYLLIKLTGVDREVVEKWLYVIVG